MLIGPWDIIVRSWKTLTTHIRLYSEYAIWFVVLGVLQWALSIVIEPLIADRLIRAMTGALIALPISLALATLTLGIMHSTWRILGGGVPNFRESIGSGLHSLLHFFWVSVLYFAVLFGGFLLLVIPGFIFFVWYKFSIQYAVLEDVHGVKALKASKKLVVGRWWKTFIRSILPSMFYYGVMILTLSIAFLIIGIILGEPGMFFGNTDEIGNLPSRFQLVSLIVTQLANGLVTALFIAAELLLWKSLKENPVTNSPASPATPAT